LHNKKALEAFGPVPFDIVYTRNKVFTRTVEPLDSTPEGGSNLENMTADVGTSEDQQLQELLDFLQTSPDDIGDIATNWMQEIDVPLSETGPILNTPSDDNVDESALQAGLDILNDSTWSQRSEAKLLWMCGMLWLM
jgi:hypothetical protein